MNLKAYIKNLIYSSTVMFMGLTFLSDVYWLESLFLALFTSVFLSFLFPGVTTKVDRVFYKLLEKVTGQKIEKNK